MLDQRRFRQDGPRGRPLPDHGAPLFKFKNEQAEEISERPGRTTISIRIGGPLLCEQRISTGVVDLMGEPVGARLRAGRHAFWISTGRAMLGMRVNWFTPSPLGHSREQAPSRGNRMER